MTNLAGGSAQIFGSSTHGGFVSGKRCVTLLFAFNFDVLHKHLLNRTARSKHLLKYHSSPQPAAVRTLKTTIQPLNSAVPWKILYSLANQVLPFPMFRSTTNSSRYPSPAPNIRPWTSALVPLSPFLASLTGVLHLFENPVALSPVFVTLTGHVRHKSFACHSYKKHPRVYTPAPRNFSLPDSDFPATDRKSRTASHGSRVSVHQSPDANPASPVTSLEPQ